MWGHGLNPGLPHAQRVFGLVNPHSLTAGQRQHLTEGPPLPGCLGLESTGHSAWSRSLDTQLSAGEAVMCAGSEPLAGACCEQWVEMFRQNHSLVPGTLMPLAGSPQRRVSLLFAAKTAALGLEQPGEAWPGWGVGAVKGGEEWAGGGELSLLQQLRGRGSNVPTQGIRVQNGTQDPHVTRDGGQREGMRTTVSIRRQELGAEGRHLDFLIGGPGKT